MESMEYTSSIYYEDENLQSLFSQLDPSLSTPSGSDEENEILNEKVTFSTSDNCLKVSDFPTHSLEIEQLHKQIKAELQHQIPVIENEFTKCNIDSPIHEMIYRSRCIESVVEQTYDFEHQLKDQMIEESCYLKKIIKMWRRVAGDGNCFYRSAMFAWLEYLIFNNQANILKRIISDIKIKFNHSYENTQKLPSNIKANLSSLTNPISLIILESIVSRLSDTRVSSSERIKSAYLILLKGFNFCRIFDTAMIYYLRYILYEFILENQDKVFSKDFPVLLGNLLPSQYETEDGKFYFMKYFEEDLLKYYTCAEKLAIYLTPFVLKIDLKVIFYDFGQECNIQTKSFPSFLPNKDCLYVLYRKAHYDICYSPEYYNKYRDLLVNYEEKIKSNRIIQDQDSREFEEGMEEVDITQSKIFLRKKPNSPEEESLKKELKKMKKRVNLYKKCSICSQCSNEEKSKGIVLPCECKCKLVFCGDKCLQTFVNNFSEHIEKKLLTDSYKCIKCEYKFSKENLVEIAFLIKINLDQIEVIINLRKKYSDLFDSLCMICLREFVKYEKKYLIKVKAPIFDRLYGNMKCNHSLCEQCLNKQHSICNICSSYHSKVINI